jgi:hypothetical protein
MPRSNDNWLNRGEVAIRRMLLHMHRRIQGAKAFTECARLELRTPLPSESAELSSPTKQLEITDYGFGFEMGADSIRRPLFSCLMPVPSSQV